MICYYIKERDKNGGVGKKGETRERKRLAESQYDTT